MSHFAPKFLSLEYVQRCQRGIVVPKSLLFNWVQEIQRFTPELTHVEYTGLERSAMRENLATHDIILTTYGTLRRDVTILKDITFDYAVGY